MAKRKNPLKDLDAFLKQEASSLINPDEIKPQVPGTETPNNKNEGRPDITSQEDIISNLKTLARKDESQFRSSFYNIIRETLESLESSSSEDKMLINTVLYLDNKTHWKENIKNYWRQ